ncbi:MAG: hypothetical protein GY928_31075 [Colwellia sp.]|nr:hypothetical protein [Colwellia sp.]
MIDCLIIGFNEPDFEDYLNTLRSMGTDSGAYKDINLAFIEYENKPYRALEILTKFYSEGKDTQVKPFRNTDFLSPTVLYLGTYLHRNGFTFDYINLFHLEKDKLKNKLEKEDILTVAITTTLYVSPQPILEIISFIKKYNDKVKCIIGGPHIYNQSVILDRENLQNIFSYINGDIYIMSQEGEFALINTLNALKSNADMSNVDNIAYIDGGKYTITKSSIEQNPLGDNMPDYGLFPKDEIGEFVSLNTSRSCPFSCSYCGYSQRAGKYRYLDVNDVETQLNSMQSAVLVV